LNLTSSFTNFPSKRLIKGWNIIFENGKIIFTDETVDDILTLLQNKRLHSELTDQDFDVESAKPLL
jgi:hypothetical protein